MFKIYYTGKDSKVYAQTAVDVTKALKFAEHMRSLGYSYVCICAEDVNCVSKPGVQAAGAECVPQFLN